MWRETSEIFSEAKDAKTLGVDRVSRKDILEHLESLKLDSFFPCVSFWATFGANIGFRVWVSVSRHETHYTLDELPVHCQPTF